MLNAYQSYLYNEIVKKYFTVISQKEKIQISTIKYNVGEFIFYSVLPDSVLTLLKLTQIPAPGYDTIFDNDSVKNITEELLADEKIKLADFEIKKFAGLTVRGISRKMLVFPENFTISAPAPDEMYTSKFKLSLDFFLSKGSYATIIIKALGAKYNSWI